MLFVSLHPLAFSLKVNQNVYIKCANREAADHECDSEHFVLVRRPWINTGKANESKIRRLSIRKA
jgi:hypothetical protein